MFDPAVLHRPGTLLFDAARTSPEATTSLCFAAPTRSLTADAPAEVVPLLREIDRVCAAGQYVAGYLSYEAGFPLVDLDAPPAPDGPLAWFGVYDAPQQVTPDAVGRGLASLSSTAAVRDAAFALDRSTYRDRIAQVRHHIREGDVYQINYTAPLRFRWSGDPRALYRHGRQRQRVSYGAYLNAGDRQILSWSPELFFHQQGDRVVTRPMKGTIRRGETSDEDEALREALAADPKNRAENLMIVDLLRNDLSRCCTPGSVQVPALFATETYDTVTQMTSTVEGTLQPESQLSDVLAALFPCGSITGAPKRRAMQIIRALETGPRGVYCGAIGFAGPDEALFNVAIRTACLDADGTGQMGIGSGIVWDSAPDAEYDECQLKAQFLTMTAPASNASPASNGAASDADVRLIETMRFDGLTIPLLDRHVARAQRSAEHFGFAFDAAAFRDAVDDALRDVGIETVCKVRATVGREGDIEVDVTPIDTAPADGPRRFCIAETRVDSGNAFRRHKTTRRDVYTQAQRDAEAAGADEAILLNERGEVTEGTWSSLFVQQGDRYVTPPVDCGLVPGVYRAHLLDTQPAMEAGILTVDDLRSADALYCCNAVRGWRRAELVEAHAHAA